jgi:hypothetical protein
VQLVFQVMSGRHRYPVILADAGDFERIVAQWRQTLLSGALAGKFSRTIAASKADLFAVESSGTMISELLSEGKRKRVATPFVFEFSLGSQLVAADAPVAIGLYVRKAMICREQRFLMKIQGRVREGKGLPFCCPSCSWVDHGGCKQTTGASH